MSIINWISKKKRLYTFLKKNKSSGSIIHKSLEIRREEYIYLESPVFLGEGCKLLCWDKYTSGNNEQELNPNLIIEKNVHASRNFICQCAGKIRIGHDTLIGSDVFIIDFNHGTSPISGNYLENCLDVKSVDIGNGVWIGNSVIILPGVSIGNKAIIAAGSVVTRSIPEYCIAAGNPAKVIKRFNHELGEWLRYDKQNS